LLRPEDLDLASADPGSLLPLQEAKAEFERRYVLEALERNGGNRARAARELGVDPRTIFRFLERLEADGAPEDEPE
jgi:DNA-binding NtrC family response regulator